MRSRLMAPVGAALLAALLAAQTPAAHTVSDAEVMRVHRAAMLIDTHNDVTTFTVDGLDIGPRSTKGHTDTARLKEGGVAAQFFAVYVAGRFVDGNHSANRTLEMIDTVRHDIVDRYPNDYMFAASVKDIEEAHRRGKIAA